MTLGSLIEEAWRDHADHPEVVATRLADALPQVERPEDIAPFVRIAVHVHGEHLGDWQRGVRLLLSLRESRAFDGTGATADPLARGIAALRAFGSEPSALAGLSDDDGAYALAIAASALVARKQWAPAIDAFDRAAATASRGLARDHPAVRAMAVCGNNVAAALEAKPDLDTAEQRAMLDAAAAGLKYWKLSGTWLEEERAEYQLSRCLLRAGRLPAARASIERCIDVCARNDAPAFELFFGHAVKALVSRAEGDAAGFDSARRAALEQYARVPEGERAWCDREFRDLGA